jgi:ABC-type dipeptide/oligopeptide/nickel transport system permease subunit
VADPQLDTITRAAGAAPGRLRLVGRRFLGNRGALVGSVMVAALFVLAFAGPLVSRWSYATIDYTALRQPPSTAHWWGTNGIGQDLFAQTVRGLQ